MPTPRKPTALKILDGNPGKRPISDREPKPEKALPAPPAILCKRGKMLWRRVAPKLHRLGLLTEIDIYALTIFCQVYIQWEDAVRDIHKRGQMVEGRQGDVVKNPSLSIARSCYEQIHKIMGGFGMSPSTRSGIEVTATAPQSNKTGPAGWDSLLR